MTLKDYVTLGRSGLRVSPLCLGTMTFGTEWGWGADEQTSHAIFTRYIEAGGNFIDTADGYTGGESEELVGKFIAERGLRDALVLATKFTFNARPGNPNAGGNGRKNIYRALEGSLRRLQTDYIDLYCLHAWDTVTPVEEVISTLSDLVREGKIRHYGFSDTPAWYVARAHTLAEKEGKERCHRAATGILARRAQHRARAHSRRAGTRHWASAPGARSPAAFSAASTGATEIPAAAKAAWKSPRANAIFERFTEGQLARSRCFAGCREASRRKPRRR